MKNESEDPYKTYNGLSVYGDTERTSRAGTHATAPGWSTKGTGSSHQGEPEWLLFHLFEKFKQFDTLKSSTVWGGQEVW